MQFNYRCRYLVLLIDANMYVYKHKKEKFEQPFLFFQAKIIFIVKSKVCELTDICGANDFSDFDGSTILVECGDNEDVFVSG